jgi:hypothetical protein
MLKCSPLRGLDVQEMLAAQGEPPIIFMTGCGDTPPRYGK